MMKSPPCIAFQIARMRNPNLSTPWGRYRHGCDPPNLLTLIPSFPSASDRDQPSFTRLSGYSISSLTLQQFSDLKPFFIHSNLAPSQTKEIHALEVPGCLLNLSSIYGDKRKNGYNITKPY